MIPPTLSSAFKPRTPSSGSTFPLQQTHKITITPGKPLKIEEVGQ